MDQTLTLVHRGGIEALRCTGTVSPAEPGATSWFIRLRAGVPVEIDIGF